MFPEITLEVGKEYCLFLEELPISYIEPSVTHSKIPSNYYFQPYAHSQGVLPLQNGVYKDSYSNTFLTETDLLEKVEEQTNFQSLYPMVSIF